ncbi:MAG: cytochrome c oxidase subunit II [Flavobacteriales bacterium]
MTNLLIALIAFLLITAVVQVVRVSELLSKVNKEDVNEITEKDNKTQGILMLVVGSLFLLSVVWQIIYWGPLALPAASSEHGLLIDGLMSFTMWLIIIVFFILHPIMFWYSYKYSGKDKGVAFFYTHNNKLELIWTVVPAIVLTAVILYGLSTWDKITNDIPQESQIVEVYSEQFAWTARLSGEDNILGNSDFRLVTAENHLGINMEDELSQDDIIVGEVHIVVNKPVLLKFRSRDVIHSAFLPHFRVQMNCVPGMVTQFGFTPTQTTTEMKVQEENEDFEFVLLCNKICGSGHYSMQMNFVVETQEEYDAWVSEQKTLGAQ